MSNLIHVKREETDVAGADESQAPRENNSTDILELIKTVDRLISLTTTLFRENFSRIPDRHKNLYFDLVEKIKQKNSYSNDEAEVIDKDDELKCYHKLAAKVFHPDKQGFGDQAKFLLASRFYQDSDLASLKVIVLSQISSNESLSEKYSAIVEREKVNFDQLREELLQKGFDHLFLASEIQRDFFAFFAKLICDLENS